MRRCNSRRGRRCYSLRRRCRHSGWWPTKSRRHPRRCRQKRCAPTTTRRRPMQCRHSARSQTMSRRRPRRCRHRRCAPTTTRHRRRRCRHSDWWHSKTRRCGKTSRQMRHGNWRRQPPHDRRRPRRAPRSLITREQAGDSSSPSFHLLAGDAAPNSMAFRRSAPSSRSAARTADEEAEQQRQAQQEARSASGRSAPKPRAARSRRWTARSTSRPPLRDRWRKPPATKPEAEFGMRG